MNNRIELMTELIFTEPNTAEEAFDFLVPKYFSELYVLYDILNNAEIVGTCEVKLPYTSTDDKLTIELTVDKDKKKTILGILKDVDSIFTPFKGSEPITVKSSSTKTGITLFFEN